MKKLIMFFGGLVLIVLTIGMLFLASAIYDSATMASVDTYFFQIDLRSATRPGTPETPTQIGETAMREMLIKKYVNEYFYVIPDVENIANRMTSKSAMARMSGGDVFKDWLNTTAEEIQSMAEHKKMRTVDIDGQIFKPADSDYWIVPYVLYTWETPNDMNTTPIVTRGELHMNVLYQPELRESVNGDAFDIGKYLKDSYNRFESGAEPAFIFKFVVLDLENKIDD